MPYFLLVLLLAAGLAQAQPDAAEIRRQIQSFKSDPRGPFQGIRWFCPDGSVRPANSPCGVPGGRQNALHKDWVQSLAAQHGLYLGQILSGTDPEAFWDDARHHSRLKQYQLERFLQNADDGWILRQARYYRGAYQAENEAAWSRQFLLWLVSQDRVVESQFFLLRQAARDLPLDADNNRGNRIRALAKTVADSLPAFAELKNKIHGRPDAKDTQRIAAFRRTTGPLPAAVDALLDTLSKDIELAYRGTGIEQVAAYRDRLPPDSSIAAALQELPKLADGLPRFAALSELLWRIRTDLPQQPEPQTRLALVQLSLDLEDMLFRRVSTWKAATPGQLLAKNYVLARAAAATGFLELWEWRAIEPLLEPPVLARHLPLGDFLETVAQTRRAVAWGAGMVAAHYNETVHRYAAFEPLALGFIDDHIRASLMLPWGETAAELGSLAAHLSGAGNLLPVTAGQAQGLNPGLALGRLRVVRGDAEGLAFSDREIYLLERAPADLKPVAGIATVEEGNAVSHVQLLARNLGIPNAAVTGALLQAMAPYDGQDFFYAVSPRGRVLLKPAASMDADEQALFAQAQRPDERLLVPTDRLDLEGTALLSLHALRATDSGRLCGPKAANLGQLSALFPGRVAPGLVIPFGVFRQHFAQPMPDGAATYWQFLEETFARAAAQRRDGTPEAEVEAGILERLARLRAAVERLPFRPGFLSALEQGYIEVFGAPSAETAVFVRSDTNMEDLKDFTGAGLNLTVPNVRGREALGKAVRRVWASPFTERSYRWRQQYLLNPAAVYPSILLQQSVQLEKSGVLITSGVSSGDSLDLTVAFSRGVGGAVDGQAAESYLLRRDGSDLLLAPAREPRYNALTADGVLKRLTGFEAPLLTSDDRLHLRLVAAQIRRRLPDAPGIGSPGPYDVELGFVDGDLRLFQTRPFVENKRAQSSLYLRSLDPPLPTGAWVPLNAKQGAKP